MKKAVYGIFIAIFGLLFATVAGATPDPGSIESNAVVQNTGSTDATVAVTYYDSSGTSRATSNARIAPNSVFQFKASESTLPSGFQGTAVVSSDQTLAAVVSLKANGVSGSAGTTTQGAYNATVNPADTLYFPSVWGWDGIGAVLSVQNTENASTDVTFSFFDRQGTALGTTNVTLAAFGSTTVDMGETTDLPDGFPSTFRDGAVTVTSSATNIAGAAHIAYANRAGSYQALTAADQGTVLYNPSTFSLPIGGNPSANGWNIFSATNIQNPNSQAIDVTIKYINREGGATTIELNCTIQPNSAIGLNTNNGGSGCTGIDATTFQPLWSGEADNTWAGSLEITNAQDLPMIGTGITQWGNSGYAGFFALAPASQAAETVYAPAQYRRQSSGSYVQWSAINVQNIGTADINASDLTIRYVSQDGQELLSFTGAELGLEGGVLAAGSAIGLNTRNGGNLNGSDFEPLGTLFSGGVVIEGPSGAELLAVQNIVYNNRASSYNGVPGN